jgi:hypothetical protein
MAVEALFARRSAYAFVDAPQVKAPALGRRLGAHVPAAAAAFPPAD